MKGDILGRFTQQDHVSKHFKLCEFCRADDPWPMHIYDRLMRLTHLAECIRGWVRTQHPMGGGAVLHVTSGYRGAEHNHRVGGAPHSQHIAGRAMDFRMVSTADQATSNILTMAAHNHLLERADQYGVGGLGWYEAHAEQPKARVHVDLRHRRPDDEVKTWTKRA